MFWKRKEGEPRKEGDPKVQKLPGPRDMPDPVKKYVQSIKEINPEAIPFLKAVLKPGENGDKKSGIRILITADAEARKVVVKDYNTLTENPDLIIGEGVWDDAAKKVELDIKKACPSVKLLTYDEIMQQVEGLKTPGSSVFFFMAAGPGAGGLQAGELP